MDSIKTSGLVGGIELHATIVGHSRIDFDKKQVRRTLLKEGRAVQRSARRLVARRAVSKPGEYPGKRSGDLQRSIKPRVGSGGFWVKVAPTKTPQMEGVFYPAFLNYGTKGLGRIGRLAAGLGLGKSNRRRRGERAELVAHRRAAGYILEPRANYMTDALEGRRDQARAAILTTLQASLKPR